MNLSPEQIRRYHDIIEEVGPEFLRDKLAQMHLIRTFEQLHQTEKTHGTLRLSIGQKATSVAAISAVRESGYLLSHHRGHGHFLSWSDDPNRLMAEILAKETRFCRGRGGKMHVADVPDEHDQPALRPMMMLTLSVDHRVVDGVDAAAFLEDLSAVLEEPGLLAW